jgi:acetolactate synthase-1/2/3 large subunit
VKYLKFAVSGQPGPVLVEIPKHAISGILTHATPTRNLIPKPISAANSHAPIESVRLMDKSLDRVARLVDMAKKPVLYVGQGMLARPEGAAILKAFAEKACIPVTTSLQGLGAFDELDPKALHMLGLHGSGYANLAIQEADLIIALDLTIVLRVVHIPKCTQGIGRRGRKSVRHCALRNCSKER